MHVATWLVTVTNWRDIEGNLYKPNTQIQVNLPKLKSRYGLIGLLVK
jgi:prophage tail gpP-like protein